MAQVLITPLNVHKLPPIMLMENAGVDPLTIDFFKSVFIGGTVSRKSSPWNYCYRPEEFFLREESVTVEVREILSSSAFKNLIPDQLQKTTCLTAEQIKLFKEGFPT